MVKDIKNKKMINVDRQYNSDKKIGLSLMASLVVLTIQYFLLVTFDLLGTPVGSQIQIISKIIVGLFFIYSFIPVFRRNSVKMILIYLVAILIFSTHYMVFPENRPYLINLIFPLFFMCLPALIYGLSINNLNVLEKVMKKASYIVFIFGLLIGIQIVSGKVVMDSYSISLSYYMLFPAIIFFGELVEKYSLKSLVLTVTSLFIMLGLGSRGAILCLLIYVFLKLIRMEFSLTFKQLVYRIIILSALTTIIFNLKKLLLITYNILLYFDINSRSILLFLREEIHLSGRDNIFEKTLKEIIENPLIGSGIAGDRRINNGGYVHNIFLEFLSNFGVLFGGIISVLLIYCIIRSLIKSDKSTYELLIIWISLGLVPLLVSDSYLTFMNFWVLVGITLNSLRQKKVPNHFQSTLS